MAWALAQCHRATWLRSRASGSLMLLDSAFRGHAAGWGGIRGFSRFCVLREEELQVEAAVPTQGPSPLLLRSLSLSFKERKIDLMTNRGERQLEAACCPLRPLLGPPPPYLVPLPFLPSPRTLGLEKLRLAMRGWMVSPPASLPTRQTPGVSLWMGMEADIWG